MLPYISAEIIEAVADQIGENEAAFEKLLKKFEAEQPAVFNYLFSEDVEAFTMDEQEWMLFVGLVIFGSVDQTGYEIAEIEENDLMDAEEKNWDLLQDSKATQFNERINPFFENYPQEDLLAFVEDMLTEDEEDNFITREGREPMFVVLKSIVDVMSR